MISRHWPKFLGFGLLMMLALRLTPPSAGQPTPRVYEPFAPTAAYYDAMELVKLAGSEREQGLQALLALAQQNPDSTLGATCLFDAAAYCGNTSRSIPLYERIVQEYPNSGFELQARQGLLSQNTNTAGEWFAGADALLQSYQAPTLAQVVANPSAAVRQLESLPMDYQHGLIGLYQQYEEALSSSNINRYNEAIALCYFGRTAFAYDSSATSAFSSGISYSTGELRGQKNFVQNVVRPKIKIRSPHGEVGARPKIRIETTLRDSSSCPVAPANSQFWLDGQEVSKEIRVRNLKSNPLAGKNQIFEQLLLEYQPIQPLSSGRHTFTALILTEGDRVGDPNGKGVSQLEIRFKVKPGERDCDDETDENKWEDSD